MLDRFSDFWPGIADVCWVVEERRTTRCEAKRSIDEFRTRAVRAPEGLAISGGLESFWTSSGASTYS